MIGIYFEKVSREQFVKDTRACMDCTDEAFEEALPTINGFYDEIKLPTRATKGSAGYDFYMPYGGLELKDGEQIIVPTGIRAHMPEGVVLMLFPRSGVGFKTGSYLANTVGVIDCDYIKASNEGHIMVKMVGGFNDYECGHNDRFVQGVFLNYFIGEDEPLSSERSGGFGSTGK